MYRTVPISNFQFIFQKPFNNKFGDRLELKKIRKLNIFKILINNELAVGKFYYKPILYFKIKIFEINVK